MISNYMYGDEMRYSGKLKRLGTGLEPLQWTVTVPEDTILCETVSRTYLGETITKTKIWNSEDVYVRDSERYERLDEKPRCPWIWIGTGETDYTKEVSQYVVHGNLITLELLQEVFREIDWSYICAESFDKKDFPVDGIQIE
jgi:hypothetical protein